MTVVAAAAIVGLSGLRAFGGTTLYWNGADGNKASAAANWCTDAALTMPATAVPATGDAVVIPAAATNLFWDLNDVELASWRQEPGYLGTVTFQTGAKNGCTKATLYGWTDDDGETRCLKITGDCTLLGGTWTHAEQPTLSSQATQSGEGAYRILARIGGNLAVTNATMDAVGKGFPKNGPVSLDSHCSSVHAGVGGYNSNSKAFNGQGPCYGTFRTPVTLGAGATNPGGGAIRLIVSGAFLPGATATFTVQGKRGDYYTGAGGSIFITAGTIAGAGTFNARGAISNGYGGGGGGGRIAFHLTDSGADFSRFTGTYVTHAQASGQSGYGGTTYFETAADGAGGGILTVDGVTAWTTSRFKRYATTVIAADCAYEPKKLVLRDAAAFGVPEGATFKVTAVEVQDYLLTNRPSVLRTQGGTFSFPADYTLPSNVTLHCIQPATFTMGSGAGTLSVGPGAVFNCDTNVTLNGSLAVRRGGLVSHTQKYSYGKAVEPYGAFDLAVTGHVTVEEGGRISAKGKGYLVSDGPTASSGIHAGLSRRSNSAVEYHCYGSITRPVSLGGYGQHTDSWGGGAVRLTVTGVVTNNGSIDADGALASHYSGAGGSVWVTAKEITGGGNISANGGEASGNAMSDKGPGAGGRVALWLTDSDASFSSFTGTVSATGGHVTGHTIAQDNGGGAGTVYYKTANQAMNGGTLVLDNAGSSTYATEIAGGNMGQMKVDVTDTDVGAVIIRNGAKLTVTNATLSVSRAWSNETANAAIGGTVVFRDANETLHVGGRSTFRNLICAALGKRILFGAGADNETCVSAGGMLDMRGEEGCPVVLSPEVPAGDRWLISVDPTVSTLLKFLDVSRSDASGGQKLVAKNSAASVTQDNVNWNFPNIIPGQEIRWTGAVGTAWTDGGNWDLGREPCETDAVVIPATANQPVCAGLPKAMGSLTVQGGATLATGGCDFTVTNVLRVAGTLVCSGAETFTLPVQSDFSLGTVVPAQATFVLSGSGAQSFNGGGCRFGDLMVTKDGGSVAFGGGFSVENRFVLRATADWTATFAAAQYACARFEADGTVSDAAALTLTGTDWTLAVSMNENVRGVKVHGSTATGLTIHPQVPSRDDGENVNWVFGATFKTWSGGTGLFTNDACWAGGVAPGAGDLVKIDAAGTVTLDAPVSVASLTLGGTASPTLKLKQPLTVAGSLAVAAGGTLVTDAAVVATNSFLVFSGGTVTHSANGDNPLYRVEVTTGDVFVEAGGKIDVNGKGYASQGPGGMKQSCVTSYTCGAGHGGIGQSYQGRDNIGHTYCYGSYFNPVTHGSGCASYAGGGVIRLAASGEARIDGELDADGQYGSPHYCGAGGSVWITCARLSGGGWIHAHGGNTSSSGEGYAGGGGRVSVQQRTARDWSAWLGRTTAYGGRQVVVPDLNKPNGSAGTVYRETAADVANGGEVIIDNDGGGCVHGTELRPTKDPKDGRTAFRRTRFTLRNGAKLVIRGDVTVWDVDLQTASSYITTTNAILTIRSYEHKDGAGWNGTVLKSGRGDVIWNREAGLRLIIR